MSTRSRTINRWWYVATGFLAMLVGINTVSALFNVLGGPMTQELGWERSVLSNGLSLQAAVNGISIVVLGFLIDRYGPRKPTIPMVVLFGGGLMAISAVPSSQTAFYALCVVVGAGAGAVNPVAHSAVITAWFQDRRGFALGILMAGLGSCGVLMPYLANFVLGFAGWRGAFLIIGALAAVIPLLIYAFVTRMPAQHDAERRAARARGKVPGQSLWTVALGSRQFWQLAVSAAVVSGAAFGLMSQTIGLVTDHGLSRDVALAVLSTASLSSIGARLLVGYLLDRFPATITASVIFAICGCGAFLMVTSAETGILFLGAALLGLGLGAEGDILAYMVSRYFPQHSYGRVLGFLYFVYAQGAALGTFGLGQAFRTTGSYAASLPFIIGGIVLAILCVVFLGRYRYSLDHHLIDPTAAKSTDEATPTTAGASSARRD